MLDALKAWKGSEQWKQADWSTGSPLLPKSFVDSVLRHFEIHAARYDGSYADRLSAALTSAPATELV